MPITTATMSYGEAAALLYSYGLYPTLEAAYAAAPGWVGAQSGSGLPLAYSSHAIATSGGAASAASSATETALVVAKNSTLTATKERVTTMGVGLSRRAGGYGFSSLMKVNLGIAGAAAAPILGVTLGADLYAANPALWTKLSQKLLPFCYPGTTDIPTWLDIIDEVPIVKVSKNVIDAVSDFFEEEGIGTTEPIGTIENPTAGANTPLNYSNISNGMTYTSGNVTARWETNGSITGCVDASGEVILASASANVQYITRVISGGAGYLLNGNLNRSFTLDGRTVYYHSFSTGAVNAQNALMGVPFSGNIANTGITAWNLIYGQTQKYFPDGFSEWGGTKYSTIPLIDPILIDGAGNTLDTVPISLPTNIPATWRPGLPTPSNDSEQYPDPTVTYLPDIQVSPYISPWSLPDVSTSPESIPLPETSDPSNPIPPATKIIDLFEPPVPSGQSPVPLMPTTDLPFSQNSGLITVYHPTSTQLYSFEEWLWVTYADATIDKIFNNPFDGVITLFELYCTPTDVGTRNIHSGFLDSGINSAVISRYTEINCGTLGIPEYYGDYFDYSPYSKAHIYLPFIGIQELNVDDIVGHAVNVTYRIDEYNGSCIAMITVAKSTTVGDDDIDYSNVMYQFSGNCSVELPLAGGTQAAIKAGMMQANAYQTVGLLSAGASALTGGVGALLGGPQGFGMAAGSVSGIVGGLSSAYAGTLSNMLSGKSTVQKSGQFGASHGALGIKKPYIVVTRPKEIAVSNYQELYGYPSHKMVTVGACTGYLRCREVHVISTTATDDEKSMIEQLLKSGVYVTEE